MHARLIDGQTFQANGPDFDYLIEYVVLVQICVYMMMVKKYQLPGILSSIFHSFHFFHFTTSVLYNVTKTKEKMASEQFGWPLLEPNEIKAPSGEIKWSAEPGSTVRVGQLLATSTIDTSAVSNNKAGTLQGSEKTNVINNANVTSSSNGTVKKKIIRARRIKRNNKPLASSTIAAAASAGNETTKRTSTPEEAKRPESSYLAQYLKSTKSVNDKVAESVSRPKTDSEMEAKDTSVGSSSIPSTSRKTAAGCEEIRAHLDGFLRRYVTIQCRKDPNNNNQLTYVLGKIEPCTHPAVIDGLCAVCGQAIAVPTNGSTNNTTSEGSKKESSTQALTLSGGVTVSISSEYAQSFSTHTSQSLRSEKKLNLVLDLDHTLLHATADRRASDLLGTYSDLYTLLLPFMEGHPFYQPGAVNLTQPHYVKLRPHLAEFLCGIIDQYEVTIYTAGTRGYAEKICEVISRHVAHYLREKKRDDDDDALGESGRCLDERDLLMLKDRAMILTMQKEEYLSRKKEKDIENEKIKRTNASIELEMKKEEPNEEFEGTHMMASEENDDDDINNVSKSSNGKKRKRVTFALPDQSNDSNAEKKGKLGDEAHLKDPSEELQKIQKQIELTEKHEVEAQNMRKKIFGSRIISRTDVSDLGRDVKSLRRVFPCGGMLAAIVDDREDVWANADNNSSGRKGEPPDNLLLCKPYHWQPFQTYADVNNCSGEDLTERMDNGNHTSVDESSEKQLIWISDILKRIHTRYYDASLKEEARDKLSVPKILKEMRNGVFARIKPETKILLSGLVPLHKQNVSFGNNVLRPPVIRYAEELGAKIVNDVSDELGYVVAARDGTEKIMRARNVPGCAVVKISWLMECYWSCSPVDIKQHILGRMPLARASHQTDLDSKKILLSDGSDEEEEDDDFFNDFEEEMES